MVLNLGDLPPVHPGAPASAEMCIPLVLLRETAKAAMVQLPVPGPARTMWLPLSKIHIGKVGRREWAEVRIDGKDQHRQTFEVSMPVWLYNKLRVEFGTGQPVTREYGYRFRTDGQVSDQKS